MDKEALHRVDDVEENSEPKELTGRLMKTVYKPDKTLEKFKAVQCPWCGVWQVVSANKRLVCKSCGRSRTYKINGVWRVNLMEFKDADIARAFCASKNTKIKRESAEKKENYERSKNIKVNYFD